MSKPILTILVVLGMAACAPAPDSVVVDEATTAAVEPVADQAPVATQTAVKRTQPVSQFVMCQHLTAESAGLYTKCAAADAEAVVDVAICPQILPEFLAQYPSCASYVASGGSGLAPVTADPALPDQDFVASAEGLGGARTVSSMNPGEGWAEQRSGSLNLRVQAGDDITTYDEWNRADMTP